MYKELQKQLHDQYAKTNDAILGSLITFLLGLIGSLCSYGYVFVYSGNSKADTLIILGSDSGVFRPEALTLMTIVALFTVSTVVTVFLVQGFAQRKQQFIIHKIRENNGGELWATILPTGYYPFGKKGLEIFQGFYGLFVKVAIPIYIVIWASSLVRLKQLQASEVCMFYAIVAGLAILIMPVCTYIKKVNKYNKICKEYGY